MKILHLAVKQPFFDEIAKGNKTEEYRLDKPYWRTRLAGKEFDEVHITNGYGNHRPFLRVECLGIFNQSIPYLWGKYEDEGYKPGFAIQLGKVLETRNWA